MPTETLPIMERLRTETRDRHDAAEQRPFQRTLFSGALPREGYVRQLEQFLLVHRALEGHLKTLRASHPAIASIVKDHQFQEPRILEDLAFFGADPAAARLTPAAAAIITRIDAAAKTSPLTLLGFQYVLEGSKNGASFLAKSLRKAYSLPEGKGDRHIDPYGPDLRARWQEFKDDMNAANFTDAESDTLVAAAREMFDAISAMGDDLLTQ